LRLLFYAFSARYAKYLMKTRLKLANHGKKSGSFALIATAGPQN